MEMDLSKLSPDQCIEIAKLVEPSVNWVFYQSKENPWNGFDLVDKESIERLEREEEGEFLYEHIFQIDFENHSFRICEELNVWDVLGEKEVKIWKYISTLNI